MHSAIPDTRESKGFKILIIVYFLGILSDFFVSSIYKINETAGMEQKSHIISLFVIIFLISFLMKKAADEMDITIFSTGRKILFIIYSISLFTIIFILTVFYLSISQIKFFSSMTLGALGGLIYLIVEISEKWDDLKSYRNLAIYGIGGGFIGLIYSYILQSAFAFPDGVITFISSYMTISLIIAMRERAQSFKR